jgi:predicted alpha-1,2-mannosidase
LRLEVLCLSCSLLAAVTPAHPSREVDPFIGSAGHGHTFPGPQTPFGMIQPGPDTRLTGWDGCSGYHDSDRVIYGFSHTHLSGTGGLDYGDILILPATGPEKLACGYRAREEEEILPRDPSGYGSSFRKATEVAHPGYYRVDLDDYKVRVELTATPRVAFHRWTFQQGGPAHALIDLTQRDEVIDTGVHVVSPTEVEGWRRGKTWTQDKRWYFVARFSRPFKAAIAVDDRIQEGLTRAQGKNVKLVLRYVTTKGERIEAQVGISATSLEGARRNLEAESRGMDFDKARTAAQRAWDGELGKIEIRGGSPDRRKVFYTALYHALLEPNLYQDVDGAYLGRDLKVHQAEGWRCHTVFSLWDTFRALHPLHALLDPRRASDYIHTFLAQYEQGGRLPIWELAANETFCMIGNHAIPVIWDAWKQGIRDFDGNKALDAMVSAATEKRDGLPDYETFGYLPAGRNASAAVSRTLEYAYDDWCIAAMAHDLGRTEIERRFLRRSQAWKNLFDPATGLMRARIQGRWLEPFDPIEVNKLYTEANAWQYSFMVLQDIDGLVARHGGDDAFTRRLETMFTMDSRTTGTVLPDLSGMIGQYVQGNEPSHHAAFLFDYAGHPSRTQAWVRRIRKELYTTGPGGLCGNDDCGQMSAWYVFAALGLYPVTPGTGQYALTSPEFPEARIHLGGGRTFTIHAQGSGRTFVRAATLNGKPWNACYLDAKDLAAGGRLDFTLGDSPDPAWGVAMNLRPTSRLEGPALLTSPFLQEIRTRTDGSLEAVLGHHEPGAAIHVTLDGTEPTAASPVYEGPIPVTHGMTIRMLATKAGFEPSQVETAPVDGKASLTPPRP